MGQETGARVGARPPRARLIVCCGVALAVASGAAPAADAQLEAAHHCTQIQDNLERLTCFDRAFAPPEAPAPRAATVAQPPAASPPAEARNVDARVAVASERPQHVYRITLEDGQVWEQNEFSSLFELKAGDTVRITKGAMGGYRMARISGARGVWVDVHRLQ